MHVPAARLSFIIRSQSAMCLLSSCLLFGGKNAGRVLLITFSRALGPIDRVGLWLKVADVGVGGRGKDEDSGIGISNEWDEDVAGAERGIVGGCS